MECEGADVLKMIYNISYFSEEKKMINLIVCDLFMFLKIKKNPEVNCLFHSETISGVRLGFSGWGLLWVLRGRESLIND